MVLQQLLLGGLDTCAPGRTAAYKYRGEMSLDCSTPGVLVSRQWRSLISLKLAGVVGH